MRKPSRVPQDRQLIKLTVRAQLSGRILPCAIACLLPLLPTGLVGLMPLQGLTFNLLIGNIIQSFSGMSMIFSWVVSILATGPMNVSLAAFFLRFTRNAQDLPSPLTVTNCFGPGYLKNMLTMLRSNVRILLPTLVPLAAVALIPGLWEKTEISGIEVIILGELSLPFMLLTLAVNLRQSFAYSMVPYLLADRPGLTSSEVLRESLRLTKGRLWELLLLRLSFMGWLLLANVSIIVGALYPYPYIEATMASYYINFSLPMPWEIKAKDSLHEA